FRFAACIGSLRISDRCADAQDQNRIVERAREKHKLSSNDCFLEGHRANKNSSRKTPSLSGIRSHLISLSHVKTYVLQPSRRSRSASNPRRFRTRQNNLCVSGDPLGSAGELRHQWLTG